jgi:glutathione S-transferase
MRFKTYDVSLAPALHAYVERVFAHPAVQDWVQGALAEPDQTDTLDYK